jgi:ribosomal protein L16 Arg81 hydroxylase
MDNDCMTYSVGLRLPSIENTLLAMIEHYDATNFSLKETFLDESIPCYTAQDDPGRIRQLQIGHISLHLTLYR